MVRLKGQQLKALSQCAFKRCARAHQVRHIALAAGQGVELLAFAEAAVTGYFPTEIEARRPHSLGSGRLRCWV